MESSPAPSTTRPRRPTRLVSVLPSPPSPTFGPATNVLSAASCRLGRGTYVGGIGFRKATVTLAAGVYYMEGGGFSVTGGGSVTGNGVVIINVPSHSGDSISVSGQGVLRLTAPTTGPFQGVAVFQAPSSSVALSFWVRRT